MNIRPIKNRELLRTIQSNYVTGKISRDEAKSIAQPTLERINQDIIEATIRLNKKYGVKRKPPLLTFAAAMRNDYGVRPSRFVFSDEEVKIKKNRERNSED